MNPQAAHCRSHFKRCTVSAILLWALFFVLGINGVALGDITLHRTFAYHLQFPKKTIRFEGTQSVVYSPHGVISTMEFENLATGERFAYTATINFELKQVWLERPLLKQYVWMSLHEVSDFVRELTREYEKPDTIPRFDSTLVLSRLDPSKAGRMTHFGLSGPTWTREVSFSPLKKRIDSLLERSTLLTLQEGPLVDSLFQYQAKLRELGIISDTCYLEALFPLKEYYVESMPSGFRLLVVTPFGTQLACQSSEIVYEQFDVPGKKNEEGVKVPRLVVTYRQKVDMLEWTTTHIPESSFVRQSDGRSRSQRDLDLHRILALIQL